MERITKLFKFTFFPFAHRHKWSKWKTVAFREKSGIPAVQHSTCSVCDKIKERFI